MKRVGPDFKERLCKGRNYRRGLVTHSLMSLLMYTHTTTTHHHSSRSFCTERVSAKEEKQSRILSEDERTTAIIALEKSRERS